SHPPSLCSDGALRDLPSFPTRRSSDLRAYYAVPFWYDETQVNQYTEGTLTVDLVDAARNRLVWTGAAIGRVTRKAPAERTEDIEIGRAHVFLRYPFRAGSGVGTMPER